MPIEAGTTVPSTLIEEQQHHYQFIRRCRASALIKARKAIDEPDSYISIAQDGTDQMGFGYPKGSESTHKEDDLRLKSKIMITMVHGAAVYMYIMPDDIENGPDESIECLQRTLQHEEQRRQGKLPHTLVLQFDYCFREGKNTYMLAYLSWLVQRGVFKRIYLSFHPVGHTHNECDQCASRVHIATARRDIGCRCRFTELLQGCYTPKPHVETLRNVVSFKVAINPDGAFKNRYPETSSVKAARNIKDTHHFLFYRDESGNSVFRDKMDVDQVDWSLPMTLWKQSPDHEVLLPTALTQKPSRPPTAEEIKTIKTTCKAANFRLDQHQRQCVLDAIAIIETPRPGGDPIHWYNMFHAFCAHPIPTGQMEVYF